MCDATGLTQLVLRERQGRDRRRWQQMRDSYWEDAVVSVSWFTGPAQEFIAASERMSARGDSAIHRLGPPVVHLHGDRALIEVPAAIEVAVEIDGIAALLTSYTRIEYRAERRRVGGDAGSGSRSASGEWRLLQLVAVYERDELTTRLPGAVLPLDEGELARFRPSYALLAHQLSLRGYEIAQDLRGDDRPDEVETFTAAEAAWLAGG